MVDLPGDTSTTATFQGDVQVVGSYSGAFETAGDSDWIRLDLVAGTTYRFFARDELAGGASGDAYLRLFDAAGAELAHDDNSGSGQNAYVSFTATTSGTYFVGVNDVGNAIAQYTIDVVSSHYHGAVIIDGEMIDVGSSGGGRFTSGSPGDDLVDYSDFDEGFDDTVFGGAGDDRIYVGMDWLDPKIGKAGDGYNTVYGGAGADSINGGYLDDILHGDDGNDYIGGGHGDDSLWGDAGDDTIWGGKGGDSLHGGDGDDVLDGGAGADTIDGGSGNDIVRVTGGVLDDTIDGGAGTDALDLSQVYFIDASIGARVDLTAGTWGANPGSGGPSAIAGIENVIGTRRADIIVGDAAANVIDGQGGGDTLQGGAGADTILGGDGNDTLVGGTGADIMKGGTGSDTYYIDNAGDLADEAGGTGIDKVYTSLSLRLTDPTHFKGAFEALVLVGGGDIDGTGNALANAITGNGGLNTLTGAAGNDTLDGRGGNDRLVGGAGADKLTGGAGADTFVFNLVGESTPVSARRDSIQDFSAAEGDRIDLTEIDANSVTSGNQAFKFLGSAAFTHHAGELRCQAVNGNAYVYGDVDGDGKADFSIQVDHLISLQASNFLL